jgi:hypothetical protein
MDAQIEEGGVAAVKTSGYNDIAFGVLFVLQMFAIFLTAGANAMFA